MSNKTAFQIIADISDKKLAEFQNGANPDLAYASLSGFLQAAMVDMYNYVEVYHGKQSAQKMMEFYQQD